MASVSILMPAYNAENTIAAAISSVRTQTYTDWELVIINDWSQDETCRVVQPFAQADPRIRLLDNTTDSGAAAARNTGLAAAQGRYIAFLDADDLWLPEKLTRQLTLMADTNAALCYSGFLSRRVGRADKTVTVPVQVDYDHLLAGNIIGCLTAIYDTKICGKTPMPLIRRRHDFALWLQILKSHGPAYGVDAPLAVLNLAPGTLSSNKLGAIYDTWRMYRDIVGLSMWGSLNNLCHHLAKRILR
jgi:teichuronic acid biosynthesis glycosyltransferase TuaG